MSMIAPKISYQSVSTGTNLKSGPAGLYYIISTVTGGAITVYDNTAASGTILFTKTLAVGDVIHFGEIGRAHV